MTPETSPNGTPAAHHEPAEFRREGLGYLFQPTAYPGVRLRADRLHRTSDGLRCRVEVDSDRPGMPVISYRARHLLEGPRSLQDLCKTLETDSLENGAVPWARLVPQFARAVVDAEERGAPFQWTDEIPDEKPPPDTLEKMLPSGCVTQWYGAGGSCKGYLAVATCVATTARVPLAGLKTTPGVAAYFDWEDNDQIFKTRVRQIAAGYAIPLPRIAYRACRQGGLLADQIHELSRFVAQHHITLVVIDSVLLAAGAGSERGSYEESTLRLITAVACFPPGTTVLLIDHVTAAGKAEKGLAGRSYGSVYKGFLCRSTWEFKNDQEDGDPVAHVGCYHTKANHGPRHAALGFDVSFSDPERVVIKRSDVRDSPTLAVGTSTVFRLLGALRRGGKTTATLAQELGIKENTIRQTFTRHTHTFQKDPTLGGDTDVWQLKNYVE